MNQYNNDGLFLSQKGQSFFCQFSPGIISGGGYTITMFPVSGAAAPPLLIGDVDGDGRVDMADVNLVLRHIPLAGGSNRG